MASSTMTLISSNTVGSGGVANYTFSSIPQTYTDLLMKFSFRGDVAGNIRYDYELTFNGNGSNYSNKFIYGSGTTSASGIGNSTNIGPGIDMDGPTATANTFSTSEVYIPNYTGSNYKSVSIDGASENNGTALLGFSAGLWSNTAAITSILVTPNSGNFVQYSTFYLYGIKNS